MRDKIYFTLIY